MFSHRSFLMLGPDSGTDIVSLIKGGIEVSDCNFSFEQGIGDKGKATTRVYGGSLYITISQLPPQDIVFWMLNSRKYMDGIIVSVDSENVPLEKIFFKQAACIDMEINYSQSGDSYTTTRFVVQAKKLIVGNGIDFDNEWIF